MNERRREIASAMLKHADAVASDCQAAAGIIPTAKTIAVRSGENVIAVVGHAHDAAVRLADKRCVFVGLHPDGE